MVARRAGALARRLTRSVCGVKVVGGCDTLDSEVAIDIVSFVLLIKMTFCTQKMK